MNKNKKHRQKYISLKEAAKISGYSSDYIGYLIREGRIPGKQIYCNVAWMTTAEAISQYKQQKEKGERNGRGWREKTQKIKVRFLEELGILKLFFGISRYLLPIIIILILSFSILVFYIFSIRLENSKPLQERFPERTENVESFITY